MIQSIISIFVTCFSNRRGKKEPPGSDLESRRDKLGTARPLEKDSRYLKNRDLQLKICIRANGKLDRTNIKLMPVPWQKK